MKQFKFNPISVDFSKRQGDVRIYHSIEFKLLHFSSYYKTVICLFDLYMMTADNSMMTADNLFMKRPRSYNLFIRILFMSIDIIMKQEMGLVMFARFFNFRKKITLIKEKPDPAMNEEENETDAPDEPTQEEPRYTGIIEGMEWINWVAANENGEIIGFDDKPIKSDHWWNHPESEITLLTNDVLITPEQAIALCGRVPRWSDEEPTPVSVQVIEKRDLGGNDGEYGYPGY